MANNPKWWNQEHDGVWDRVKAALKRDWEQTKADVSKHGTELDQNVGDTVKQAAGTQPIPPANTPNPKDVDDADWKRIEPDYRYGAGAAQQHGKGISSWDDRIESKLKEEWGDLKSGRTWDEAKAAVRGGWDRAKK